jgi:phosphoribosylanthranilate isomerase
VFVDMPIQELIETARVAALDTVQLHGSEPLSDILAVQRAGFHVVKVLKVVGTPLLNAASELPASVGILVECGTGILPGGNGARWNWGDAALLADLRPFALAGGLTPENLAEAANLSRARAWDISSGVETSPGVKNHVAILNIVNTLADMTRCQPETSDASHFWSSGHDSSCETEPTLL